MKKLSKKVASLIGLTSKSDVNGSYTGKPLNPKEKPVQDADNRIKFEIQTAGFSPFDSDYGKLKASNRARKEDLWKKDTFIQPH